MQARASAFGRTMYTQLNAHHDYVRDGRLVAEVLCSAVHPCDSASLLCALWCPFVTETNLDFSCAVHSAPAPADRSFDAQAAVQVTRAAQASVSAALLPYIWRLEMQVGRTRARLWPTCAGMCGLLLDAAACAAASDQRTRRGTRAADRLPLCRCAPRRNDRRQRESVRRGRRIEQYRGSRR